MSELTAKNLIPEEFFDRDNLTCSAENLIEAEQDVINDTAISTRIKVVKCISDLADHYELDKNSKGLLKQILIKMKEGQPLDSPIYGLAITIEQILKESTNDSEEKYKALFENSQDALTTITPPNWNFTLGNPTALKMFGYDSEEELASVPPWELSPEYQPEGELSKDKAKRMIEKSINEGVNYFYWTHKRKNGEEFPASVLLTPLTIGESNSIQATMRDLTKLKVLEKEKADLQEQYVQAQKMEAIGTLAGGIAHDFNNLLTVILGNIDFAKFEVNPHSQAYQDLEEATKAGKKAVKLTNGILAYSRKQSLNIENLNLNP